MTTGEKIKSLRLKLGMTQEELGNKIGVKIAAINKYETGLVVNLKRSTIQNLAKALDTTPAHLMGWEDDTENVQDIPYPPHPSLTPAEKISLPMLGKVAAGTPIFLDESFEFSACKINGIKADYCLLVEGNSMIGAGIENGDVVLIRSQSDVESGEIAVVYIDEEVTIKRVEKYPHMLILRPDNPKYEPIVVSESEVTTVMILGKVVGLTRSLE